jgi:subtilisin family serine protease
MYDEGGSVDPLSSSQRFQRPDDPGTPDLVGPGVDVVSCMPNGGFAQSSGSSMATPHIAGLAALLLEAKPHATTDELEAAIFASCNLPPTMSVDRANRGIPNGPRALRVLVPTWSWSSAAVATARRTKPRRTASAKRPGTPAKRGRRRGKTGGSRSER